MKKYLLIMFSCAAVTLFCGLLFSQTAAALRTPQLILQDLNSSQDYDSNYYFERIGPNSPATISDNPSPIDSASINEIKLNSEQTSEPFYLILSHPLSDPNENAVLIRVVSNGSNAISIKSNGEYQMQPEYGSGGIAFSWKASGNSLVISFCKPTSFSNGVCHRA